MSKNLINQVSMNINKDDQEVLFETSNSRISQSDSLEKYLLNFQKEVFAFRACELISFRRKIQNIDLTSLLDSETPDIEIINMPHCNRLFILTVFEVLELRELLAGTFTMLELNSLIHREILRKFC